jgi:hypothetical protein
MARKVLFVLFSDDVCRQNHALMYALELREKGHEVKLILEGSATRMVSALGDAAAGPGALLREARDKGILAGACGRASSGCASEDPARKVADVAEAAGVRLLSEMRGHASVEPFVRDGYELVVV